MRPAIRLVAFAPGATRSWRASTGMANASPTPSGTRRSSLPAADDYIAPGVCACPARERRVRDEASRQPVHWARAPHPPVQRLRAKHRRRRIAAPRRSLSVLGLRTPAGAPPHATEPRRDSAGGRLPDLHRERRHGDRMRTASGRVAYGFARASVALPEECPSPVVVDEAVALGAIRELVAGPAGGELEREAPAVAWWPIVAL